MPRILDKNGRELREGAKVERSFPNGKTGGIVGEVVVATKLDVMVKWPGRSWDFDFYKPSLDSLLKRTYRCNDLELVDPPAEEAASTDTSRPLQKEVGGTRNSRWTPESLSTSLPPSSSGSISTCASSPTRRNGSRSQRPSSRSGFSSSRSAKPSGRATDQTTHSAATTGCQEGSSSMNEDSNKEVLGG